MPDILNETNVTLTNNLFKDLLPSLQGNILNHHGRTHAYHIFLQIKNGKKAAARKWISNFAKLKITSAFKQLSDSAKHKSDPEFDGGVFFNLSLSFTGYQKLGVPAADIPSADPAFKARMRTRTSILSDKLNNWEDGFKKRIDALIIVADKNVSNVTNAKDKIISEVKSFANAVYVQKGKILRNEHGIGIEHFGYADGVSQPNFLKPADPTRVQWDDNGALLSTLLVKEPGNKELFGSYFVFRKLEQNVKKFKTQEETLPPVKQGDGIDNDELAGAMIVGRFEDGSEVINHFKEKHITTESQLFNDFDYRDDKPGSATNGSKCPFHAHIRITNPRADVPLAFAKKVRLIRRGIPFNDIGRDEFNLEADQPEGGVGLLFMCYQSSLIQQFEFIQQSWANKGDIGGRLVGQDAIIGQGPNNTDKFLPGKWGVNANQQKVPKTFKDFVTMRGGEYFFTPSIPFLKSL
jgi:Dyp-type peroxidase family